MINTLHIGEKYKIEITEFSNDFIGIGRINNIIVFVKNTVPGDIANIELSDIRKNYAVGDIIDFIKLSSDRVDPFCAHYYKCGGCSAQNIKYSEQLRYKNKIALSAIEHIGGIDLSKAEILPPSGMDKHYRYRNKAEYTFGYNSGKLVLGMRSEKSHFVQDICDCMLQNDTAEKIRSLTEIFFRENELPVYNPKTRTGILRQLCVRTSSKSGNAMIILIISSSDVCFDSEKYINMILSSVKECSSIYVNHNSTGYPMSNNNTLIYGQPCLSDSILGRDFEIAPNSFFQVNSAQTEKLYTSVIDFCSFDGNEVVWDLYCGIGTISLIVSDYVQKVIGIENVSSAIENAVKNAIANKVSNAEFICGDVSNVVPDLISKGSRPDTVILDPPRKGCSSDLINCLLKMLPGKICYISCNPSTLARDLKLLVNGGYNVEKVQCFDMFVWTKHVETVVLLRRVK